MKRTINIFLIFIIIFIYTGDCFGEIVPVSRLSKEQIEFIKKENNQLMLYGGIGLLGYSVTLFPLFRDSTPVIPIIGIVGSLYVIVSPFISKTTLLGTAKYSKEKGFSLGYSKFRKYFLGIILCLGGGYTVYSSFKSEEGYSGNDKYLMIGGGAVSVISGTVILIDAITSGTLPESKTEISLRTFPGYYGIMLTRAF